jgi:hypothetical protein
MAVGSACEARSISAFRPYSPRFDNFMPGSKS